MLRSVMHAKFVRTALSGGGVCETVDETEIIRDGMYNISVAKYLHARVRVHIIDHGNSQR